MYATRRPAKKAGGKRQNTSFVPSISAIITAELPAKWRTMPFTSG
jgi:hypothetical protein